MGRSTRLISLPAVSKTTLLLMTVLGSQAYASGFQLFEYNTTDIGLAGAGGAAYAEDASTNFTNPAGLVNIKNPEFVVVGNIIDGDGEFHGQACGGAQSFGACDLTDASANGGTTAFVPAFHYAMPITDRIYAGLSVTAPFGLSTDYGDNSTLRYSATKSEIKTIDINPGIAFKFTDQFSLGAGLSAQKMNAELDNDVNLSPGATAIPVTVAPGVTVPGTIQYSDSELTNKADDWGWGWNVGGLYQFTPGSRLGVSYRSQVKHDDLEGNSKYSGGTGVISVGGTPIASDSYDTLKTDDSTDITLPATTTISFYQELTSQWAMMASAYYTQWHSIQNVTLKDIALFSAPTGATIIPPQGPRTVTLPENFDNTWRLSLGTEYKVSDDLTLRAGGSHDESPVNNTDRTVRLPDSDRWSAGVGAGYRFNQYIKVDAGYEHVWFGDADINQTQDPLSESIGDVDVSANIYSLSGTIDIV